MITPIKLKLKQTANRLINGRIPLSNEKRFGINNTYVFFSHQGTLFALMLLTTFVAGVNYGNNLILGLSFYLFAISLVAIVVTFVQVSSLSIVIHPPKMGRQGSLIWVELTLINHQGAASRQIQVSFEDEQDNSGLLSSDEQIQYNKHKVAIVPTITDSVSVRLPIIAHKRGQITLPRIKIKSQYPLGIIQTWGYARPKDTALAYPKPISVDTNNLTQARHGDEQNHHQHKGQDDFDRLDTYVLGESLSRVSWSHLARGVMLSKHFGDPTGKTLTLDYHAMPSKNHEEKLAMLSFLVLAMQTPDTFFRVNQEAEMAFVLNLPSAQGELGSGLAFIEQCLMRLANEP